MFVLLMCLSLVLGFPVLSLGANAILDEFGTAILFGDASQTPTPDVTMTLTGLPAARGRVSNQVNRGSPPFATTFRWQCQFALTGTLTGLNGSAIEVYIARSYNGTVTDNSVPTLDSQLQETTARSFRSNLMKVGFVSVDNETTNQAFRGGGEGLHIPWQFWQLVVWNPTTQAFAAVGTTPSFCIFTPYGPEVQ